MKGAQCQFTHGSPERAVPGLQVVKPCAGVMATLPWQDGAVSWFVVLLDAGAPGRPALVLAVDTHGAREVPEWEAALGATAREGNILPLMQACSICWRPGRSGGLWPAGWCACLASLSALLSTLHAITAWHTASMLCPSGSMTKAA